MESRLYRCSDANFFIYLRALYSNLEVHLPVVESKGITQDVIDNLKLKYEALDFLSSDLMKKSEWRIIIKSRQNIRNTLLYMMQEITLAVFGVWKDNSGMRMRFGVGSISHANNRELASRLREISGLCAEYAAELTPSGINAAFVEELNLNLTEFERLSALTPQKLIERKEITAERIAKGNELYLLLRHYAQTAIFALENAGVSGSFIYKDLLKDVRTSSKVKRKKKEEKEKKEEMVAENL